MTDKPASVHTHIERDRRRMWHAAITIRQQGKTVFALVATQGYDKREPARMDAVKEAVRLERMSK